MIREEGVVIETQGGSATVQINRASACAHCKARCMERGGFMVAEADNPVGAQVGDTVRLEFNSRAALAAVLIVFGIPLLALFLGVILTSSVADRIGYRDHNQLLSIGVGMVLFFLTFIPIRIYDRRIKKSGSYNVAVVEVLKKATP